MILWHRLLRRHIASYNQSNCRRIPSIGHCGRHIFKKLFEKTENVVYGTCRKADNSRYHDADKTTETIDNITEFPDLNSAHGMALWANSWYDYKLRIFKAIKSAAGISSNRKSSTSCFSPRPLCSIKATHSFVWHAVVKNNKETKRNETRNCLIETNKPGHLLSKHVGT